MEEALGVGKWTAWRIMKRCDAQEGPGGALVCQRVHLLSQLRQLQEDRHFAPEIERRERLERYLDGIVQYASRQHKEVARNQQAEALLKQHHFETADRRESGPGELRIEFSGSGDFIQEVGAVIYALHNDLERIEEFIECGSTLVGKSTSCRTGAK